MYKQKDSKRNKMKGWKYEGTRHGLAAQGIHTGRKIRSYTNIDLEGDARNRDLKEFSKLLNVIELLKKDNVNAVDLSANKLSGNSPFIIEFVKQIEGLEIVGNEIRKVDRIKEMQRFIEIRESNIKKYEEELKLLPKKIEEEKQMLEDAKEKLKLKEVNNKEENNKDLKLAEEITEHIEETQGSDIIEGGLADDKTDKDFDAEQLKIGMKVELEHTDNHRIAKEIARDHLTEDPQYYKKLAKQESLNKYGG